MIVIRKREAARALYWALVAYFAISTLAPLATDFVPDSPPSGGANSAHAALAALLKRFDVQVYASVAIGVLGYLWPRPEGYPTTDTVGRALLLALVVGTMFIAVANQLEIGLSFWTGFKSGFVVAALFKPPSERARPPE